MPEFLEGEREQSKPINKTSLPPKLSAASEPSRTCELGSAPEKLSGQRVVQRRALYGTFLQLIESQPEQDAIIVPRFLGYPLSRQRRSSAVQYTSITYRDLGELVLRYEKGLSELGMCEGDRVLMLVPPGVDFLALSYAVMGRGATPVFLDPGMGLKNLLFCIADCEVRAFLGSPKAHLLRLVRRDLFKKLKFSLLTTQRSLGFGANLSIRKRSPASPLPVSGDPEIALIAFTSGATGVPKGVPFTAPMIDAQLAILKGVFGIKSGQKNMPFLPAFALLSLALGATTVFPPIDPTAPLQFDPAKIVRILTDLKICNSLGAPTLWAKIADHGVRTGTVFPHLRRVFMAGAPISERTLTHVQNRVPSGSVFTAYGATEALPVTLIAASEALCLSPRRANGGELGTLLGRAVHGVELRIIAVAGHAFGDIAETTRLGPGEIGEVIVRGVNVSHSYLNRPEETKLSKVRDGETAWHRMGDVGYLDEAGNLYFCGRKVHIYTTPHKTYYTEPTERVFNVYPKVRRSALIGVAWAPEPAIVIEPLPEFWPTSTKAKTRFAKELRRVAAAQAVTSALRRFFFHPAFPVDSRHNAKILREQLANWAVRKRQFEVEDE
jgi:olefin beta-lactone synthetase